MTVRLLAKIYEKHTAEGRSNYQFVRRLIDIHNKLIWRKK